MRPRLEPCFYTGSSPLFHYTIVVLVLQGTKDRLLRHSVNGHELCRNRRILSRSLWQQRTKPVAPWLMYNTVRTAMRTSIAQVTRIANADPTVWINDRTTIWRSPCRWAPLVVLFVWVLSSRITGSLHPECLETSVDATRAVACIPPIARLRSTPALPRTHVVALRGWRWRCQ